MPMARRKVPYFAAGDYTFSLRITRESFGGIARAARENHRSAASQIRVWCEEGLRRQRRKP